MSALLSGKRVVTAWVAVIDDEVTGVWLEKSDAQRFADTYNAVRHLKSQPRAKVRRFRGKVAKGGAA